MADTKISALTALTGASLASNDLLPTVDTSAVQTKKITIQELLIGLLSIIGVPSNIVWQANNTLDIGASAARPRYIYVGSALVLNVTTVAGLPAAATASSGARAFVSDATAPSFGAVVAGGGTVQSPVYSDGTAWRCG